MRKNAKRKGEKTLQQQSNLHGQPLWILEPKLFEAVLRIVSKHDVEKIILGENPRGWTEYAFEVEVLLPLLKRASGIADVKKSLRQVFRQHFSSPSPQPDIMAGEIWRCIRSSAHKRALKNIVDLESPIRKAVSRIRRFPARSMFPPTQPRMPPPGDP